MPRKKHTAKANSTAHTENANTNHDNSTTFQKLQTSYPPILEETHMKRSQIQYTQNSRRTTNTDAES